ncbi:MAG: amidase [bacterium]|nr:amidase [bacterium]
MPEIDKHLFLNAVELAKKIREGEISAADLLNIHLEHIARFNPLLRAIVTLDEERARQRAQEADEALLRGELWGPLHGVPVTIKDSLETEDLRTTSSFKPLANYIPRQDSTVAARIRSAGAVILGKTNMPTLAMDVQTISPLFGEGNNPWDITRTPGGSTGGGAAALAAGFSALEIGSDIAGSIRIPSHFCGVYGLKPTEHLVPLTGHIPEPPGAPHGVRHLAVNGPLARSIEDLRLALTLIAGPDKQRWETPPVSIGAPPALSLNKYRFAWTDDFGGVPVDEDTKTALEKLAGQLADQGCSVEKCGPTDFEDFADFDFREAWYTWGEIFGSELGASMPAPIRFLTSMKFRMMSKGSILARGIVRGLQLNMTRYAKALDKRDALITKMEAFLDQWDGWLCPVTATPAFHHQKPGKSIRVDRKKVSYHMANMGYTSVFNLTGNPVVVLPVAYSRLDLPIGVQLVGHRWKDMELLNAAEAISTITGGFQRPHGYVDT